MNLNKPIVKLNALPPNEPQKIVRAKITNGKFGESVLLELEERVTFLPARVTEVFRKNIQYFSPLKYSVIFRGTKDVGLSNPANLFEIVENEIGTYPSENIICRYCKEEVLKTSYSNHVNELCLKIRKGKDSKIVCYQCYAAVSSRHIQRHKRVSCKESENINIFKCTCINVNLQSNRLETICKECNKTTSEGFLKVFCYLCKASFESYEDLENHLKTEEEITQNACKYCFRLLEPSSQKEHEIYRCPVRRNICIEKCCPDYEIVTDFEEDFYQHFCKKCEKKWKTWRLSSNEDFYNNHKSSYYNENSFKAKGLYDRYL